MNADKVRGSIVFLPKAIVYMLATSAISAPLRKLRLGGALSRPPCEQVDAVRSVSMPTSSKIKPQQLQKLRSGKSIFFPERKK